MCEQALSSASPNISAAVIQNPRAATASDYNAMCQNLPSGSFHSIAPLEQILKEMLPQEGEEAAPDSGTILCCGSIYLLGELFPTLKLNAGSIWV